MSSILEHVPDEDTIIMVDLGKQAACEGSAHPENTGGHNGGPAAYALVSPCCGMSVLQCEGRVHQLFSRPFILCDWCGRVSPTMHFVTIEL
jgi:hypothetical protein